MGIERSYIAYLAGPLLALGLAVGGCESTIGSAADGDDGGSIAQDASAPVVDAAPVDADPRDDDDAIEPQPVTCDDGTASMAVGDICYMYFEDKLSWYDAQTACSMLGGYLADIVSAEENLLLQSLVPNPQIIDDVWVGGNDLKDEGVFLWLDGTALAAREVYENFRIGEPNNNGGVDADGNPVPENCLVVEVDTELVTWDDRRCDATNSYFCKRSSASNGGL